MTPEEQFQSYAITGNESAFAKVVEAYAPLVYGTAFRRTRNAPLAEEICQNVFVIAARKAGKVAGQPGLGGLAAPDDALRNQERAQIRSRAQSTSTHHERGC